MSRISSSSSVTASVSLSLSSSSLAASPYVGLPTRRGPRRSRSWASSSSSSCPPAAFSHSTSPNSSTVRPSLRARKSRIAIAMPCPAKSNSSSSSSSSSSRSRARRARGSPDSTAARVHGPRGEHPLVFARCPVVGGLARHHPVVVVGVEGQPLHAERVLPQEGELRPRPRRGRRWLPARPSGVRSPASSTSLPSLPTHSASAASWRATGAVRRLGGELGQRAAGGSAAGRRAGRAPP